MVIVLVRPSLGDVPGAQSLIPRGEVFQSGLGRSDVAFDEVAVSIPRDLNICTRGGTCNAACRGYLF